MPHLTSCTSDITSGGVGSCVTTSLPRIYSATNSTIGSLETTSRDAGSCVTTSSFWGSPIATSVAYCEDVGSCGANSSQILIPSSI